MRSVWQDIRFGLRQWRRAPGFATVAVLTLALGIAANVTVFSLANGIFLAQPPIAHPHRVAIITGDDHAGFWGAELTGADMLALRGAKSFAGVAAAQAPEVMNWIRRGAGKAAAVRRVGANFFPVLGVQPVLGRDFTRREAALGGRRAAILSHGFWVAKYASNPNILGRQIQLGAHGYTIVGVMPASFGAGVSNMAVEIWLPLALTPADLAPTANAPRDWYLYGRLRAGVTLAAANAELATVRGPRVQARRKGSHWTFSAMPLRRFRIMSALMPGGEMWLYAAGAAFVLLIACANIAGLLLARGEARRQEMAVRAALGAGRGRVTRQLLAENLMLGLAGGALGLLGSAWGLPLLRLALPARWGAAAAMPMDGTALGFTAGATLFAVLLFGLGPAWLMARADPQAHLQSGAAGGVGVVRARLRRILTAVQIALAVVLLAGAGFLVQQAVMMLSRPFGFSPRNAETVTVSLPRTKAAKAAAQVAYFAGIAAHVRALPGVLGAGWVGRPPLESGGQETGLRRDGKATVYAPIDFVVSPGYLAALGAPLLAGRDFRAGDDAKAPPVVMVNAAMVRHYFGGKNPVGRFVQVSWTSGWERRRVVGVVGDVEDDLGQLHSHFQIYLPMAQAMTGVQAGSRMVLLVRSHPGTMPSVAVLDGAIWAGALGRTVQVATPQSYVALARSGAFGVRTTLISVMGVLALLLAAVGLFGVVAYLAARRTREFAVRSSLGAQRSDIGRLVAGETARTVGWGMAAGMAAAWFVPRLLGAVFYQFLPASPVPVLAGVGIAVVAVAALASLAPALRATRADPLEALRYE